MSASRLTKAFSGFHTLDFGLLCELSLRYRGTRSLDRRGGVGKFIGLFSVISRSSDGCLLRLDWKYDQRHRVLACYAAVVLTSFNLGRVTSQNY